MRTCPRPIASLTASTRSKSSFRVCPGSATFTFAVAHPDARTIAAAFSGPTAGTVQFTGTTDRTGGGQPSKADSRAARSQATQVASSYSRKGDHSAQPAGPSNSIPSRTVMPRNLFFNPIA